MHRVKSTAHAGRLSLKISAICEYTTTDTIFLQYVSVQSVCVSVHISKRVCTQSIYKASEMCVFLLCVLAMCVREDHSEAKCAECVIESFTLCLRSLCLCDLCVVDARACGQRACVSGSVSIAMPGSVTIHGFRTLVLQYVLVSF